MKSNRSYFVKPPLSSITLFFRQKEMEREYRDTAHRISERHGDSPPTLATSRFNTYFDIFISALVSFKFSHAVGQCSDFHALLCSHLNDCLLYLGIFGYCHVLVFSLCCITNVDGGVCDGHSHPVVCCFLVWSFVVDTSW